MRLGMAEEIFEGATGKARVRRLAPGLWSVVLEGRCELEVFEFMYQAATPEIADGSSGHTIFFDSTAMTGFTTEFRLRMMVWQQETRGRQFQVVLVRSRVLAAAITLSSKLVGVRVSVTADREHFDRLLAEAVRGRFPEVEGGEVQSRLPRL